jgi:hypothetical protein
MRSDVVRPFESIESALEFMVLLEDVIAEASDELQAMLEQSTTERYSNGLNLALYKVHQLSFHVQKSRRILNDLTLVRRVLVSDSTTREDESATRDTSGIPSTLPPFSV